MSTDHPSHDGETSKSAIGLFFAYLFACLLYFLLIGGLQGLRCCDPNGGIWHLARSSRQDLLDLLAGFLLLDTLVLWMVLGLLLMGAVRGEMPRWAAILAVVVYPLTLVAAFASIDLRERYHGWAIVVPVLLPPLIGLYAIWARFNQLYKITSMLAWAAILVLTIAPIPLFFVDARSELVKERIEAARASNDLQRQQFEASLARLTPDSSLRDYLSAEHQLSPSPYQKQQWLEGVRRVKSRQADAITLLKEGEIARLGALWQFNIEATPALCEAFGDALGKLAAKIDPTPFLTGGGDLRVMRAPEFLRLQLQNIKWLSAHCDLDDTLAEVEAKVRTTSESLRQSKRNFAQIEGYRMEQFAAALAEVRHRH